MNAIYQSFYSPHSYCNKKTQELLLNSFIYVFTGAVSGLLNRSVDILLYDEKERLIFQSIFFGSVLGLGSGWTTHLIKKAFGHRLFSSSNTSSSIIHAQLKTPVALGIQSCKKSVTRFLGKPFVKTLPNLFAGLFAAFSDDLSKWEWEPIIPQSTDLFIGAIIGFIVCSVEFVIRNSFESHSNRIEKISIRKRKYSGVVSIPIKIPYFLRSCFGTAI